MPNKPFTVAWKNQNEPIKSDGRNPVTCEICKKQGFPFPPWFYWELSIMTKLYEYEYWVCGEECGSKVTDAMKKKRIKELS